jgi:hypothetical protein
MSEIRTWIDTNTYLLVAILVVIAGILVALGYPLMAAFMVMAIGLLLMRRVEVDRKDEKRA